MADVTSNKKALAVNAIQGDENTRKEPTISIYLKPTTMRGIPLVDLTPSPVIRGFYVTKGEDDSTRTSMVDFTLQYATTDNSIELQTTESTLIPDISTTNEIATRAYNDQSEESNTSDGNDDRVTTIVHKNRNELNIPTSAVTQYPYRTVTNNEDNITGKEQISDFAVIPSENSSSAENLSNVEEPDIVAIPDGRVAVKRRKTSSEFAHNETTDTYVVSTTSPTRRKIALAVNRYNKATTPLWTGRRIVAKKRHRTTVSPIKNVIRRTESKFAHSTASIFRNTTATISTTPSTLSRTFPTIITTISTVPLNTTQTETTLTNLAAEPTSSLTPKIISTAVPTAAVISTISDNFTIITRTDASLVATTPSTVAVAKASSVGTDAAETTFAITSPIVETTTSTTSNYFSDIPTYMSTNDFVTANTENESNYSTDFANTASEGDAFSTANYSETTAAVNPITDSSITAISMNTEIETTSTNANYSSDTTVPAVSEAEITFAVTSPFVTDIPATANVNTITTDFSVTNPTVSMTTNNLIDTVTLPASTISTVTYVITSPANVSSSFTTSSETVGTMTTSTSSVTSPKLPVTDTPLTSSLSTKIEPNILNSSNNNNLEILAVIVTEDSIQTTPTLTSTFSSNSEESLVSKESKRRKFSIPSYESSVATTIQTTASTYPPFSTQTTSEYSTTPKVKTNISKEEATSSQNEVNDPTTTMVYESNFKQTTNNGSSTIPEVKPFKKTTSKSTEMTSERNIDYGSGRKASRRRIVNRTNNWNGWSIPQQTNYQYPRRVTLNRTQPRRPPSNISSARTRAENLRRRVAQKRARVNPETIGSIVRSDENIHLQNTTEESVAYDQVKNTRRGMRIAVKKVKEITDKEGTTTLRFQSSTSIENKSLRDYLDNKNTERNRYTEVIPKKLKSPIQQDFVTDEIRSDYSNSNNTIDIVTNSTTAMDANITTTETTIINTDNKYHPDISENSTGENRFEQEKTGRRMRVVLKSVRPMRREENSTEEASANSDSVNKNLRDNFSSKSPKSGRGRMRVVLKSIRLKEDTGTIEKASAELGYRNEIMKRVEPKFEEMEMRTEKVDVNFVTANPQDVILHNNSRDNLLGEYGRRRGRRMRVVLKSVKPKFEESNLTPEGTDSADKDLQGSFSSNPYAHESRPNEKRIKNEAVPKKTEPISVGKDSITEETEDSPIIIVSAIWPLGSRENRREKAINGTNVLSKRVKLREEEITTSAADKTHGSNDFSVQSETEQTTTEQQEDTEATILTEEEDTDRFSFETTSLRTNGSLSRKSGSGANSIRRRKPTQPTTVSPLISTVPSYLTTRRRSRPIIETTLSPRIDFNVFDGTESYVKSAVAEDDQKTDVSDQNIRAQEYAVTLADSPISSSNTGRTPLGDVEGRKISTTVTPRMYPTTERTVTRYSADIRGRQKFRTKNNKPATLNTTARPRGPPVIDYDYYEDEVPVVIGRSFLNSKLFLTSRGTIRCLDQGNFPHPYSCKKFITCARMVNGQVIGTEYTCPDKLSFDPIGGICNWSAGLGCKE